MKNKKPLIITLVTICVLAAIAAGVWFFWLQDYLEVSNASPVYVNSVSSIIGLDTGANPRYSGIVEPQRTYKINKDESKTVEQVFVSVGDEVHVGDVLFRYDTEELQFSLEQAKLDQEGIANQINTLKRQLTTLNDEKKKASKDDQYAYTVQIESVEYQINAQEFESQKKKSEIDRLQEALDNTDVFSEYEGIVKEVNTTPRMDSSGQTAAFISILSAGEYRIKGTVSELNVGSLAEGQAVVVRSRIDSNQTWNGTVESIDREAAADQNNNYFYYGMDSGEKSSKYNFYVLLDNLDGLILGQHVYIEPFVADNVQREGMWLPAMYIGHDDKGSFVWAKNDNNKLEKRVVLLGEYDSGNDMYEIKSGVTRTDYIAYPGENLKSGMPTTTDASVAVMPETPGVGGPGMDGVYDDPGLYMDWDGGWTDEPVDNGSYDGDFYDDGIYGDDSDDDTVYGGADIQPREGESYDGDWSSSDGEGYAP